MRSLGILALLLAASLHGSAAEPVPELTELLRKAAPYRPFEHDLVWRQIPWLTNPSTALKQMRDEKRPLFVWIAGGRDRDGSPLERC